MLIYLSGKISGENILDCERKFYKAAKQFINGIDFVIIPITLAKNLEFHIKGNNDNFPSLEYEVYLKNSIKYMLTADKVVFLSDWENSEGAKFEKLICDKLKIPYETI